MRPGDDDIAVDFPSLSELAGELEDIIRTTNEQLEILYGRVEKVVLTWEGETRHAFVDELDRWDVSAQDLEALQTWLHARVVNGHVTYAAAHRAVLRGWGAA
ncbi:WXG100 family type VII secretion target [Streptomyces sp. ISL-36]|uniref:WXG100 family type VII secretion target n=1 Tax=Streptomyces sp. ISL-36 TaxID=2819182 RepID=UPI001BE8325E|nr:WXG100 family type VII secretion target [Streptomyces sp. ISL-36]MBT2442625.1 WXG100 family type VII secretion target [Streptomyces sp. ISL-36]